MTILVTGGAGYIGSHTVRLLRNLGRDVVVLDSLERADGSALLGAELVVGSIADEALVTKTCRDHNVTAIVHFAAYKSVGESMSSPGMYWQNNVAGTVHLAEGALAAGVQQMVFSSSASVYGNPTVTPITEDAEIQPENVYAESKASMERVLSWYGETNGLQSVSLRYFNAAGASLDGVIGEDWSVTTNLIPLVMKAVLGVSGPVQVFGNDYPTPDGTGIRDYIHVEDLARAHVAALDYLGEDGASTAVNLGTGVGSSVLEILRRTAAEAGREVPHDIVARRIGDPATVYADPTAAEALLGWTAHLTLDDIIRTAYAWHASQVAHQ
jgi:UDP-glucose-4-epimerase GalE